MFAVTWDLDNQKDREYSNQVVLMKPLIFFSNTGAHLVTPEHQVFASSIKKGKIFIAHCVCSVWGGKVKPARHSILKQLLINVRPKLRKLACTVNQNKPINSEIVWLIEDLVCRLLFKTQKLPILIVSENIMRNFSINLQMNKISILLPSKALINPFKNFRI